MKEFFQFITEGYVEDLLKGSAKGWDGGAGAAVGKYVVKKGTAIGSILHTNYKIYKLDGQLFQVSVHMGRPHLVHRIDKEPKNMVNESVAANAAGGTLGANATDGTSIAGYDPIMQKKVLKRSKFAGTDVFEVNADTFQKCHTGHGKYERWDRYLQDDCDSCRAIREYAKRHPQKDIIIQREGCGTMTWLKKQGVHY